MSTRQTLRRLAVLQLAQVKRVKQGEEATGAGRFFENAEGCIVGPLADLQPDEMRRYLPEAIRSHKRADEFLQRVAAWAADWYSMSPSKALAETQAAVRSDLQGVGEAAHVMRNALQPLALANRSFEVLSPHFDYLALRARESDLPTAGRPDVPALPNDVPDLLDLLRRIDEDLKTLQVACEHAASRVESPRSLPADRALALVRGIAEIYRDCYGKAPPKRSWFADEFITEIGERVGLKVGHTVVANAVESTR